MRTLLKLGGLCLATLTVCGQGSLGWYVALGNFERPGARVYDTDGVTPLYGSGFLVQLYAGSTPDSLSAVGATTTFFPIALVGYFRSITVQIPDGDLADPQFGWLYAQVRVWEAAGGSTYGAAVAAGAKYGISNIFRMSATYPPQAPAELFGLQSFALVPEPTVWALGLLGAGCIVLARRRWPRGP